MPDGSRDAELVLFSVSCKKSILYILAFSVIKKTVYTLQTKL